MKRALLALLTCSSLTVVSCSASSETHSISSQEKPATNSTHDAVVAALKKWTTVKSFRQRFTSTSGGAESSGSMEFVAPDRVHFVMNIAGEPFETITIGQTEYTKDADGSWVKTTLEVPATKQGHLFTDPQHIAQLADNVTDVRLTTTERAEGTLMKVYTFKHKLPDTPGVFETQMSIALSDGLPRKIETKYDFTVEGLRQSGRSSIICSDYNSEIRIEPPIK